MANHAALISEPWNDGNKLHPVSTCLSTGIIEPIFIIIIIIELTGDEKY